MLWIIGSQKRVQGIKQFFGLPYYFDDCPRTALLRTIEG